MATMKLTVNDDVILDGDLGEWTDNPPALLTDQLKAGAKPRPWMRAVLLTVADFATGKQSMDVNVQHRSNRWTLAVEYR